MKVALYHPWVYLRSGVERWVVELVSRSRHDWTVYTHHYDRAGTYPQMAGVRVVELAPRVSVRRSLGEIAGAATTIARTRLPDDGSRALLVSSEGLGDLVALRSRVPTVAYCHTPLKILHDPAAGRVVRASGWGRRLALAAIGPAFTAVDRRAWRRYRHVFVNSDETLARVSRARLRPSGPVEVLEPAVDDVWVQEGSPQERPPVFLYAGRVMWQKNVELAIEALRRLERPASLVVAGAVDAKSGPYLEALREQARGLPVSFEITPSDERLRDLYAGAAALLFTARNEDFGIVALEAMGAGTMVLAVDAGGPRSTVTAGTGWLLPDDPAAWAARMAAVLDDPPSPQMRAAARAAARRRSWDTHVARLDAVLSGVAAGRGLS